MTFQYLVTSLVVKKVSLRQREAGVARVLTKIGEFAQSFAGGELRLLGFIRATQGW